ncbi:MAG: ATP-binding protein [Methanosphaera stadtmanae]|nr:ATP-binding protein [Methanosphaera stadtmanae]
MVKRDLYLNQIIPLIDNELIKIITGIRRCGKSYMLGLIKEELITRGINENNIILINFESAKYRNVSNARELDLLIESLIENIEGKVYLFFDEIQNVDGWEKSVNACRVDWDCDIYITGSNSKLLSGELATHLTGRYFEIKMYPFSFKEFLDYKQQQPSDKLFNEYLKYGGFPQIFIFNDENKLKYLHDLFNSILYNDLISRYQIRDVNILERLILFLMDNVGKTFSAKSLSDYLKEEENVKIAPKTIYNYINYLTNSRLINKVQRENVEGKTILKIHEKYYVTDHGFNQVFNGRNVTNVSRTIENIVYVELLRKGYDVTIGKISDYEIDFIAKKYKQKIYIQVSYCLSSDETIQREFRPLLKVKNNYPKYVISTDNFDFSQDGIIHQNLIDFLLNGPKQQNIS